MSNNKKITLLKGDGIGPEIISEAVKVLAAVSHKFGFTAQCTEGLIGGGAIDATGVPLPAETVEQCKHSDAILLGAVGGPKWEKLPGNLRPEAGLLDIRETLNLFANLRPAKMFGPLKDSCPLRPEIIGDGMDIMVVRELTGGIYFGKRGRETVNGVEAAFDTEYYTAHEVERIARVAFDAAMKRGKKLHSIDKANVLESSRLWREVVIKVAKDYPEVTLEHLYVDNAAMQLVLNPKQFDVILASNIFGDILSDEASQVAGSIGMLASASLGETKLGLYEPIHGSAPDIAGKNIANPLATILSVSMMLRYSLDEPAAAAAVEDAVVKVLEKGYRTSDIATGKDEEIKVGTAEMGDAVVFALS